MTPDTFTIVIAVVTVGAALAGLVIRLRVATHRDVDAVRRDVADVRRDAGGIRKEFADLRERMARLGGLFEGFTRREPAAPEKGTA